MSPDILLKRAVIATTLVAGVACRDAVTEPAPLPDPPENVAATISARNHVALTWLPRPETEKVVRYSVYRDKLRIGETATTSYVDSIAPPEMDHAYAVASHSVENVVSGLSSPVSIFAPDPTPPRVFSIVPAEGEINVSSTAGVQVKFTDRMNPSSLVPAAFDVRETLTDAVQQGTVTYDSVTRTATWRPVTPFPPERRIRFTVTTSVRDASGNALASNVTRTFTIREGIPPFIVSFFPAPGSVVPVGQWPWVQFSERLRLEWNGYTRGVRLLDYSRNPPFVVSHDAAFDTLTNIATVTPFNSIHSFRPYTVEINDLTIDVAGNPIANQFQFTFQFDEWRLPDVVSVSLAEGATNVPLSGKIVVELSAPVMPVNDYRPSLEIRAAGGTQSLPIGSSYGRTNIIQFSYSNAQPHTSYIATFYHFFTDSKGVRREVTRQWTFTTGS